MFIKPNNLEICKAIITHVRIVSILYQLILNVCMTDLKQAMKEQSFSVLLLNALLTGTNERLSIQIALCNTHR